MKKVTAAIIIKNSKVLIARRASDEKLAGGWEFPGGKIEDGETPEECLARELQEELCIDAKINQFVAESQYEYEHGAILLLAYAAEIVGGQMKLCVHDKIEWTDKDHLLLFGLLPADIPIARKVVKELL